MSQLSTARLAAALGFLAGAAVLVGRRLRRGGRMDVKEIERRLAEDPWRGRLEEVLDLVADDYVLHVPGSPEPLRGKEGYRSFAGMYMAAFPDAAITVLDQIAEGDTVATRWTGRGTNTGELMGMPASGREVTVSGITYSRLAGGKARESWITWDTLGMFQQLGAVPETIPARAG